jgi:long-chain acyl-CoA synthetase
METAHRTSTGTAAEAILGTGPIEPRPLWAILDDAVARYPGRPCIDFLDSRWSYAAIGDLVSRAAAGFRKLGVRKGVTVGLCLPNTHYYVVCYFAILKAGGIVVNYNPLYVERELAFQIKDSGTRIMVTMDLALIYPKVAAMLADGLLDTIVVCPMADALSGLKRLLFPIVRRKDLATVPRDARHVPFARLVAEPGDGTLPAVDPVADVAVLQYTGGTTGVPKGAMLTHHNIRANAIQAARHVPSPDFGKERMLGVLPLFHVFAMTVVMNAAICFGAELVLLPRFELGQVMQALRKKRPTMFPGVPTIYTVINTHPDAKPENLSSLSFCMSGGAPLPMEVKLRFEALTGCSLVEGYGLSEASPVVTANPPGGNIKTGSIGLPLYGTTIELRDPDTGRIVEEVGKRGEICVRGPQVMLGYWNRPDETARVFIDGALRTGDVGYRDEEGYYYLVDRIKDLILCGGYNVYPRVIEEALYRHPDVAEAVVIGIPDAYRGQAPKAFVKLRDGAKATPETLHAFLTSEVSKIEMPKLIEIRDTLPRTLIGKLSKKELVEEETKRIREDAT